MSAAPRCHLCRKPVETRVVTWVRRAGKIVPVHKTCLQPPRRVHGVKVTW